ncbi:hypothetical protein HGRIS_005172 [Hohenbuehelia grisea]|uniref:Hydrophobin n=1 Tax=Hohenbuehelia grisea TaxID=104357 RepID=A0ABR3JE67_9AGAR
MFATFIVIASLFAVTLSTPTPVGGQSGHPFVSCSKERGFRMCCGDVAPQSDPRVAAIFQLDEHRKEIRKTSIGEALGNKVVNGSVGLNCDGLPSVRTANVLGRCGSKIACCTKFSGKIGFNCEVRLDQTKKD